MSQTTVKQPLVLTHNISITSFQILTEKFLQIKYRLLLLESPYYILFLLETIPISNVVYSNSVFIFIFNYECL